MPTYDFYCEKCKRTFEFFFVNMSDAPMEKPCPECIDAAIAKRIISPGAGFKFNQPGGTYRGAKNEAEVQQAMKDYATGNNQSKKE